ncbi:MAG: hypothetical protein JWQ81_6073 [Amycolatopsis sp.]|uniref:hypothetical protein n=1 Tax=Amycolatopsis sp. TaxID=37632 RepID=UPI0026199D23|nr:hypothetical protein [Amycolatopsis sp.]MCU1685334.1 hypothetical protein [Amycolatopsis sp.]
MTIADQVPAAESEVWHSAVSTLEDGLAIYPLRSLDGVRFCGATVSNTAVSGTATDVLLRVTESPRGTGTAWEISMPPEFARYLAALLDAHARYIQSAPTRD